MPFELSEIFMAPTEREVQLVVDAMPMLEQRIAEIEKSASAAQIVNQANVQAIRSEFTDSCNKVVDQASAKFAHIELQARELHETAKAIVDGAGQEFHSIKSTIVVAMQEVESAVAAISLRVSVLEAHANKVVTQDQVALQTEIKTVEQRISRLEATVAGGSGASGSASTKWNVDEEILTRKEHDPKDVRGRTGPVARMEGRCCGFLGHTQRRNAQVLAGDHFEQGHAR